ncbi:RsiV family protein [Solibacillus sp. FSL W7-1464]|uniref:RsiV family protein n=1 Tax=Solibacillus sp. FSL W7-1464 TaxID=2921706 RepID=UPI0030F5C3BA
MHKKIKQLNDQYKAIPIPKELEIVVAKNLQRPPRKKRKMPIFLASAAAAALLFTAGLNTSPTLAKNLAEVPIIGSVVKVLTFTEYELEKDKYTADIKVPQISGSSSEIQALNKQYVEEGKELYEQFKTEIENMEAGNMAVNSGYIVQTDTDDLLSFGRYVEVTVVSSSTVMKYTTIDKRSETVITLPSLFKDDRYLEIINTYIEDDLRNRMIETKGDEMYWIGGTEYFDETMGVFEGITPEQNFYITDAGKLVMSFNDYEIAPGFMGVVTVEIPTELLQDVLMSNQYIK